jgi:hypothetical protein
MSVFAITDDRNALFESPATDGPFLILAIMDDRKSIECPAMGGRL